jgi:hypothetical protein
MGEGMSLDTPDYHFFRYNLLKFLYCGGDFSILFSRIFKKSLDAAENNTLP